MERIAYVLNSESHKGRFRQSLMDRGKQLWARAAGKARVNEACVLYDERLRDIGLIIAVNGAMRSSAEELTAELTALCERNAVRLAALEEISVDKSACGSVRFFDGVELCGQYRLHRQLQTGFVDKNSAAGLIVDADSYWEDISETAGCAGEITIYSDSKQARDTAAELLYSRLGAVCRRTDKPADIAECAGILNLTRRDMPIFSNFRQIYSPYIFSEPPKELYTAAYAGSLGAIMLHPSYREALQSAAANSLPQEL